MGGCDYIAYRWARAQIGGWADTDVDRAIAEQTKGDPPFYGVIALAMLRADSLNLAKLQRAFIDTFCESVARYNSPGSLLSTDPEGLKRNVLGERYSPELDATLLSAAAVKPGAFGGYTIEQP